MDGFADKAYVDSQVRHSEATDEAERKRQNRVGTLIGWSLERSGLVAGGKGGFFFQTVAPAMQTEGDVLRVLDVLLRDVGVRGVFSDWPATTTFMAHCRKPAAP